MTPARALAFLREYNSLEGVVRQGWAMSGVPAPEDVAAHTAGVGVAALLIADWLTVPVDRARLLTMALLHDVGEARTGDVPLVVKTEADEVAERAAADAILAGLPAAWREAMDEYRAQATLESRIVKAADKLQMMAKVLEYEASGRGDLSRFWENPRNFADGGLPEAGALFDAVRAARSAGAKPGGPAAGPG